ncbi:MAG: hypothetical protein Q9160_004230 [Pyrenula sp. 1 TL-2023]
MYQNIKLDTGPIRMDSDLGFNISPNLQYTIQIISHCAPLATEGYKQIFNYSDEISYMRYHYGQLLHKSQHTTDLNFTFESQIPSVSQTKSEDFTTEMADYQLGYLLGLPYNGSLNTANSSFIPNDDLLLTDSDVIIIYMSAKDVIYTSKIDDPWYAAHHYIGSYTSTGSGVSGPVPAYISDEPASALGCKQHYQVCGPGSSPQHDCVISGGEIDVSYSRTDDQDEVVRWIMANHRGIGEVVETLTTSSLTSRFGLAQGTQGPLPDDQWQSEVEFWHNIGIVSLQSITAAAIGPDDPNIQRYFWGSPPTEATRNLCNNQKIRSPAYSNFSVLGLSIVLVIGGIIIVLGYTIEYLIDLIERRLNKVKYSRLEWGTNDILQTQRMAYEGLGIGTWCDCAGVGAVPVTEKNQMPAVLNIEDPKHPRLKVSSTKGGIDASRLVESPATKGDSHEASGSSSGVSASGQHGSDVDNRAETGISGIAAAEDNDIVPREETKSNARSSGEDVHDGQHELGTASPEAESHKGTTKGSVRSAHSDSLPFADKSQDNATHVKPVRAGGLEVA